MMFNHFTNHFLLLLFLFLEMTGFVEWTVTHTYMCISYSITYLLWERRNTNMFRLLRTRSRALRVSTITVLPSQIFCELDHLCQVCSKCSRCFENVEKILSALSSSLVLGIWTNIQTRDSCYCFDIFEKKNTGRTTTAIFSPASQFYFRL